MQIPVFPSGGFDATAAFYGHFGFVEAARYGDEYLLMRHEIGMEVHFYGAGKTKPRTNDHVVYVRFESASEIDALYARWSGLANTPAFARVAGKIGRLHAPVDTDYGLREFALIDHDGNLARLGGQLDEFLTPVNSFLVFRRR